MQDIPDSHNWNRQNTIVRRPCALTDRRPSSVYVMLNWSSSLLLTNQVKPISL